MKITIRKFERRDVPNKVIWINDPENNKYLHYNLPLEIEKTYQWYEAVKDREDRFDAVFEADGEPIGIIGLLSIDYKNKKAEYYITLGDRRFSGKHAASEASRLLLRYAFEVLNLNRLYLYTESENHIAQHLLEKIGFTKEGILKNDLFCKGQYIDRYLYGITNNSMPDGKPCCGRPTPIQRIGYQYNNDLYIKRDDLLPFSFGGNKARKAELFFKDIEKKKSNYVVTYGSGSSNHCRVVANLAASKNIPCLIISPEETKHNTFNSQLMHLFGANIINCPVDNVANVTDEQLCRLRSEGYNPYFIAGGGHGNIGTEAYVECFDEILDHEKSNGLAFDYIFLASGTGTTQAGLVCGKLIRNRDIQIVGISIARKNPYGKEVVRESIESYLKECNAIGCDSIDQSFIFTDEYVSGGYGKSNSKIDRIVRDVMIRYGVPLNTTYSGKAFWGMTEFIKVNKITSKKILFIHTGGSPLFFDDLERIS